MRIPLLAILLLSAGPACAGPYDQPWSIITTDRAASPDFRLRPVIVNRVDDRNADTGLNQAVVQPGSHQVTVDLPPRKGFPATQRTFELTTEPCTRYYVAAELDSTVGQQWKPVVRSRERIGECESKFGAGK
ncbi:MAG TPA: hypothetical protein VFE23_03750 [Usitatibacter sp.]|jgi:hypothetical protein|nr:hypothetical protein [Usitatibacter sp.]